jgi:thiol-disulfide isomerase/thioredoxin
MNLRRGLFAGVAVVAASFLLPGMGRAEVPLNLDDLRGRVVYLDFWASWCAPCRFSFPWMQSMKQRYGDRGLTVVAINVDRDRVAADRFLSQYHTDFEVRFDPAGQLAERFRVSGMPTGVLIDRHGQLRYTHVGFRPADESAYEQHLRTLVAEQ